MCFVTSAYPIQYPTSLDRSYLNTNVLEHQLYLNTYWYQAYEILVIFRPLDQQMFAFDIHKKYFYGQRERFRIPFNDGQVYILKR